MENVVAKDNPGHLSKYLKADQRLYPCGCYRKHLQGRVLPETDHLRPWRRRATTSPRSSSFAARPRAISGRRATRALGGVPPCKASRRALVIHLSLHVLLMPSSFTEAQYRGSTLRQPVPRSLGEEEGSSGSAAARLSWCCRPLGAVSSCSLPRLLRVWYSMSISSRLTSSSTNSSSWTDSLRNLISSLTSGRFSTTTSSSVTGTLTPCD